MTRVGIIGGGVMGLGIAWRCAQRGAEVTVLEKGENCGREASWAAAGMLAPMAELEFDERELLKFALESQRRWPEFAQELEEASGHSIGLDTKGTLVVGVDRDDLEAIRRTFDYQRSLELPVRWVERDELREIEPALGASVLGGIHSTSEHQVDNRALVTALERAAEANGCDIHRNYEVAAVDIAGSGLLSVRSIDGETLTFNRVVVAAGAWSRSVVGLSPAPPVRPVRGQMLAVRQTDAAVTLGHVVRGHRAYLAPKSDGRIVVGATTEERGFDRTPTAGGVFELLEGARELMPGVDELPLLDIWTGFRPGCRDLAPLLGESSQPGVHFATGHYRNGIQQTPATVDLVSRAVLGDPPDALIVPFSPQRFAR